MAFVCILVCLTALAGCGSPEVPATENKEELATLSAEVIQVEPRLWPEIVRTQGSLVADEVSVVGSRVTGRIDQVHVDLGDQVREGDPLVTLDRVEFKLLVDQAEAQLNQSMASVGLEPGGSIGGLDPTKAPPVRQEQALWDEAMANLTRGQRLYADKITTQAELDQLAAAERVAAARYASALNGVQEKIAIIRVRQAELGIAREHLENAVLKAPFNALIQQRQVAPGMYVQTGDSIATLVRIDPLRFRGTMPERHAQQLKLGQEVELHIKSLPAPKTVKITRISPSLDLLSRALMFEAQVANHNGKLRSGLFAEAKVVLNPQAESIVVPHSSLVEFAGTQKIWKVTDGVAGELEVLIGQRRPEGVEILSGLFAGDVILRNARQGRVARIQPTQNSSSPATQLTRRDGSSESDGNPQVVQEAALGSESGSTSLE